MRNLALREEARRQIAALASLPQETDLAQTEAIFILGPYGPDLSKAVLTGLRDALLQKYRLPAFLEEDINLPVNTDVKFEILLPIASQAVFALTNAGLPRGWQLELGQLAGYPEQLSKVAVFYEDFGQLQQTVRDFLLSGRIRRHGPIVHPDELPQTIAGLVQQVITFAARIE